MVDFSIVAVAVLQPWGVRAVMIIIIIIIGYTSCISVEWDIHDIKPSSPLKLWYTKENKLQQTEERRKVSEGGILQSDNNFPSWGGSTFTLLSGVNSTVWFSLFVIIVCMPLTFPLIPHLDSFLLSLPSLSSHPVFAPPFSASPILSSLLQLLFSVCFFLIQVPTLLRLSWWAWGSILSLLRWQWARAW